MKHRLTPEQKEIIEIPCGNPDCSKIVRRPRYMIDRSRAHSQSGLVFCSTRCGGFMAPPVVLSKSWTRKEAQASMSSTTPRHCNEVRGCTGPGWYEDTRGGLSCEAHRPLMVVRMRRFAEWGELYLPEEYNSVKPRGTEDLRDDLVEQIVRKKLIGEEA